MSDVCEWEGGRRSGGRSGAALKTKTPHANVGKKTKPFHLTFVLCLLLEEVLQFQTHQGPSQGLNHVGDWGTQFGMLIEYMKEAYPNFQDWRTPETSALGFMLDSFALFSLVFV